MNNLIIVEQTRPLCSICGINPSKKGSLSVNGFRKYHKHCSSCEKKIYNIRQGNRQMGYQLHKQNICEICGFIPEHSCQLDVDHVDGNKDNNELSNLQTLCANCHRLKTHKDRVKNTVN